MSRLSPCITGMSSAPTTSTGSSFSSASSSWATSKGTWPSATSRAGEPSGRLPMIIAGPRPPKRSYRRNTPWQLPSGAGSRPAPRLPGQSPGSMARTSKSGPAGVAALRRRRKDICPSYGFCRLGRSGGDPSTAAGRGGLPGRFRHPSRAAQGASRTRWEAAVCRDGLGLGNAGAATPAPGGGPGTCGLRDPGVRARAVPAGNRGVPRPARIRRSGRRGHVRPRNPGGYTARPARSATSGVQPDRGTRQMPKSASAARNSAGRYACTRCPPRMVTSSAPGIRAASGEPLLGEGAGRTAGDRRAWAPGCAPRPSNHAGSSAISSASTAGTSAQSKPSAPGAAGGRARRVERQQRRGLLQDEPPKRSGAPGQAGRRRSRPWNGRRRRRRRCPRAVEEDRRGRRGRRTAGRCRAGRCGRGRAGRGRGRGGAPARARAMTAQSPLSAVRPCTRTTGASRAPRPRSGRRGAAPFPRTVRTGGSAAGGPQVGL